MEDAAQTSSGYPDPLQVLSFLYASLQKPVSVLDHNLGTLSFSPCRCSWRAFSRIHC